MLRQRRSGLHLHQRARAGVRFQKSTSGNNCVATETRSSCKKLPEKLISTQRGVGFGRRHFCCSVLACQRESRNSPIRLRFSNMHSRSCIKSSFFANKHLTKYLRAAQWCWARVSSRSSQVDDGSCYFRVSGSLGKLHTVTRVLCLAIPKNAANTRSLLGSASSPPDGSKVQLSIRCPRCIFRSKQPQ